MKKFIILGLMMLCSVAFAITQDYPWDPLSPVFVNPTWTGTMSGVNLVVSGYCTVGTYATIGTTLKVGTVLQVGNGQNLLGKTTFNYNYSTASSDEDVSFSFISTGTATGNSGKVSGLRSEYNWYGGDNATFIGEGLEGVVRSRAVDTNMTGRGVSGRIYAGTGYTMKTGIGVEGAWRIEEDNHPAYGSSYSGVRAWCYPGWQTNASTNVVNNYGVWIENQHATNEVAQGLHFGISYGGKFTKEIGLQNGETIDNYTDGQVLITAPITAASGMLNVAGTSTFASSVTVAGNGSNGRLQVIDQINTRTLLASGTMYIGAAGTTAMLGSLEVQSGVNVTGAICAHARSNSATVGKPALLCESETSADMIDGFSTGINFIIKDVSLGENTIAQIAAERAGADGTGNILFKPYTTGAVVLVSTLTASSFNCDQVIRTKSATALPTTSTIEAGSTFWDSDNACLYVSTEQVSGVWSWKQLMTPMIP